MAALPSLLTLPVELQLLITAHLTAPEVQLLRFTSRHFYTLLPPSRPIELDEIEGSPYNRYLFSNCFSCLKLYPDSNYTQVRDDYWAEEGRFECNVCKHVDFLGRSLWEPGGPEFERVEREREELRKLRRGQGLDEGKWDLVGC